MGKSLAKFCYAGKPLIASVAGFSVQEYLALADMASKAGADLIELNLGCPNTSAAGVANPIFSFDLDAMKEILDGLASCPTPFSVKLSPYSNPAELGRTAAVIAASKAAAIVTCNTFPNGYWQDDKGAAVIGPNGGLAGTSGEAMLAISVGQVKQFRSALPEPIAVIGVGGITKPEDVTQYLNAGASAVQVATHIVRHGHAAIDEVIA